MLSILLHGMATGHKHVGHTGDLRYPLFLATTVLRLQDHEKHGQTAHTFIEVEAEAEASVAEVVKHRVLHLGRENHRRLKERLLR